MTKEELLKRLAQIRNDCNGRDEEQGHSEADKALIEYVNDKDITRAFNRIDKFYA